MCATSKDKVILTPVLRFWALTRQPFDDYVLRDEDLDIFVDRDKELRKLHNALSNPLCGVFGPQGIGKSSLLFQLGDRVAVDGYPVATVEMTGTSQNLLYREILASILRKINVGDIKTLAKLKLNVTQELQRVEYSIKFTSSVEAAGEVGWKAILNLVAKVGAKEGQESELPQHTEDTATALIRKIILNSKEPFVVLVDNLERVKYLLDDPAKYFQFITGFAKTVDSAFSDPKVCFVVTLDQTFADRIQDGLPGTEEASSFSFGQLVPLGVFPPKHLYSIIQSRLYKRNWKGSVEDFLTREAFWGLALTTSGHPRRAFAVLRETMEIVADRGGAKTIELSDVQVAATNCNEVLDETDLRILKFLVEMGPHSSSDKPFTDTVGITRRPLADRLANLSRCGLIEMEQQKSGTATKDVYFLPTVGKA